MPSSKQSRSTDLSTSLAEPLRSLGHDVATVYEEHLQAHPDTDVWQAVVQEQRFLITQDVEFGDLRRYPLGLHEEGTYPVALKMCSYRFASGNNLLAHLLVAS